MARQFITVDYAATLKQTVTLAECLPTGHLARFIVGIIALLDLSAIYARYATVGGAAFAPELLLGLLFYGYATGVFSSRKLEQATYEAIPFRFMAGGLHPDHDTLAHFRKPFLPPISELFVQVLLGAADLGVLQVGRINVSFDGSKSHADASKSHAVSYDRLLELEKQLRSEVAELLALGEPADQGGRAGRLRSQTAGTPSQNPGDRPPTRRAAAPAAAPRGPAARSIQLHRSRFAHYEKQYRPRLRPGLQRPGGGGSSHPAGGRPPGDQPSLR